MAEVAVSGTFLTFASDLQVAGRLDRIVIDECHVIFTSASYRRQLPHLDRLRAIPCQFVLLTGTLPPRLEAGLADAFLLGTSEQGLTYIRAITDRSNVAYRVEICDDGRSEMRVCEVMKEARRELRAGQRAVAFCFDRALRANGKCVRLQAVPCEV